MKKGDIVRINSFHNFKTNLARVIKDENNIYNTIYIQLFDAEPGTCFYIEKKYIEVVIKKEEEKKPIKKEIGKTFIDLINLIKNYIKE